MNYEMHEDFLHKTFQSLGLAQLCSKNAEVVVGHVNKLSDPVYKEGDKSTMKK